MEETGRLLSGCCCLWRHRLGGQDLPGPGADSTWTGSEPAETCAGRRVLPALQWPPPTSPRHRSAPHPACSGQTRPRRPHTPILPGPPARAHRSPQQPSLTPRGCVLPCASPRLTECLENHLHTQTFIQHWPCAGLRAKCSSCFILLVPVSSGGAGGDASALPILQRRRLRPREARSLAPGPQAGQGLRTAALRSPRWPGPPPCSDQQMAPVPTGPSRGQAWVGRGGTWWGGRSVGSWR